MYLVLMPWRTASLGVIVSGTEEASSIPVVRYRQSVVRNHSFEPIWIFIV